MGSVDADDRLAKLASLIRRPFLATIPLMDLKVGIITISDRASQGLYDDLGGPALKEAAQGYGWEVVADALVADEKRDIQRAVLEQLRQGR